MVSYISPLPQCLVWSIHVYKESLQRTDKDPGLLIGHLINKGITLPLQISMQYSDGLIHCTNPLQPMQ